jgi:hypothetical protein
MKKRNSNFVGLIIWLVMIITVILCLLFDKWFFNAIYNSDMPTWLKYFFLK